MLQIVSLIRGTIAERSGIRVGHCIIEMNGTSTVGMEHADVVHLLSTTVGDVSILFSYSHYENGVRPSYVQQQAHYTRLANCTVY